MKDDAPATVNRGGVVHYGDSTKSAVAAFNTSLGIDLTASDLRSIPVRSANVSSDRFRIMWLGAGSVAIDGGTRFSTGQTTFLDKGQQVSLAIDGSQGAKVMTKNGVLMQVMEDDDPGHDPPGSAAAMAYTL